MYKEFMVALLAEGVDRNLLYSIIAAVDPNVALLAEGVDRNIKHFNGVPLHRLSPSSRRA